MFASLEQQNRTDQRYHDAGAHSVTHDRSYCRMLVIFLGTESKMSVKPLESTRR